MQSENEWNGQILGSYILSKGWKTEQEKDADILVSNFSGDFLLQYVMGHVSGFIFVFQKTCEWLQFPEVPLMHLSSQGSDELTYPVLHRGLLLLPKAQGLGCREDGVYKSSGELIEWANNGLVDHPHCYGRVLSWNNVPAIFLLTEKRHLKISRTQGKKIIIYFWFPNDPTWVTFYVLLFVKLRPFFVRGVSWSIWGDAKDLVCMYFGCFVGQWTDCKLVFRNERLRVSSPDKNTKHLARRFPFQP